MVERRDQLRRRHEVRAIEVRSPSRRRPASRDRRPRPSAQAARRRHGGRGRRRGRRAVGRRRARAARERRAVRPRAQDVRVVTAFIGVLLPDLGRPPVERRAATHAIPTPRRVSTPWRAVPARIAPRERVRAPRAIPPHSARPTSAVRTRGRYGISAGSRGVAPTHSVAILAPASRGLGRARGRLGASPPLSAAMRPRRAGRRRVRPDHAGGLHGRHGRGIRHRAPAAHLLPGAARPARPPGALPGDRRVRRLPGGELGPDEPLRRHVAPSRRSSSAMLGLIDGPVHRARARSSAFVRHTFLGGEHAGDRQHSGTSCRRRVGLRRLGVLRAGDPPHRLAAHRARRGPVAQGGARVLARRTSRRSSSAPLIIARRDRRSSTAATRSRALVISIPFLGAILAIILVPLAVISTLLILLIAHRRRVRPAAGRRGRGVGAERQPRRDQPRVLLRLRAPAPVLLELLPDLPVHRASSWSAGELRSSTSSSKSVDAGLLARARRRCSSTTPEAPSSTPDVRQVPDADTKASSTATARRTRRTDEPPFAMSISTPSEAPRIAQADGARVLGRPEPHLVRRVRVAALLVPRRDARPPTPTCARTSTAPRRTRSTSRRRSEDFEALAKAPDVPRSAPPSCRRRRLRCLPRRRRRRAPARGPTVGPPPSRRSTDVAPRPKKDGPADLRPPPIPPTCLRSPPRDGAPGLRD